MLPGLTPEEARDLMLSVGTHHGKRRLSPVEVAALFQKALEAGATQLDCARFVNLTEITMISRFLRLLNLDTEIRHIVDWGHQTQASIAFESAWRLGELNGGEQAVAAREIIANGMGKEEVLQILQLRRRSQRPIEECFKEVILMRKVVVRRHVFLGAVTDMGTEQALRRLRQIERDQLLAAALMDIYGNLRGTSGKLGPKRFTIVTDEEGSARLKGSGDFEGVINKVLLAKVSMA